MDGSRMRSIVAVNVCWCVCVGVCGMYAWVCVLSKYVYVSVCAERVSVDVCAEKVCVCVLCVVL